MTKTLPVVDTQTGSVSTSQILNGSATSSLSGTRSLVLMSQSEMKTQLLRGFSQSTFLVDLTAEGAPLDVNLNDVQEVLDLLRDYNITQHTLLSNDGSTEDAPRLPLKGFKAESDSYKPLTHFLNIIVRATKECLTPRYLGNLRFIRHDAEMKDAYNSQKPLKPNVLGLLRSPPAMQKISWSDVAIVIEVKNKELDLVHQLSTYARCYLAADRRRSFSITIAFNHENLQMRFLIFHRSGLSSSREISLFTEAGFRGVVTHLVGILSIADEKAFGLDMTRFEDMFRINNRNYKIVRQIHERNVVRGHATAVYSVSVCAAQDTSVIPQSRHLTLFGATQLPDKMVYKLSYQPEGHTLEGDLLRECFGQFGVVDVVGSHVCALEEPFSSTAHHIRNCTFWNISESKEGSSVQGSVYRAPVNRFLHCTALGVEGLPFLDTSDTEVGIPGPVELLESILHAMIGHYNLFLGGVLHRDVSSGNILRLQESLERVCNYSENLLRPELGEDVNLSSCRAFLTDFDHSIEWRKDPPTPSTDRSGTLPFMARRLVAASYFNTPVLHTAADDLESFLWVLVWALTFIFKHTLTNESPRINLLVRAFSSYKFIEVISKGTLIDQIWPDEVFNDLIQDWLKIAEASCKYLQEQENKWSTSGSTGSEWGPLEEFCRGVYMEYIKAGYKHLSDIRGYQDWKAVVNAADPKLWQGEGGW